MNKNKIVSISLILIMCIGVLNGCGKATKFESADEYLYNMHTFSNAIVNSYDRCNELGTKISNIWHDAIMEEIDTETILYTFDTDKNKYRDFNDALSYYMQSEEYINYKNNIIAEKDNILNLYTTLNNLPKKYSKQFEYIKDIYDNYSMYQDLMLSPSGTYEDFVDMISSKSEIKSMCNTLDSLIPDYENEEYSFDNKELYISFYYGLRYGKYTGIFSNGNVNGEGVFSSTNADGTTWIYTGNFKNGHFSGIGKSEWSNGMIYEGEYKDDLENGQGKYTLSDGTILEGTFKNGEYISQ